MKLIEHNGQVVLRLLDRTSHPFMPEMMSIIVPYEVMTFAILGFMGEDDPIQHIQKQEYLLLGRTNDDNHYTLLFPTTLKGTRAIGFWYAEGVSNLLARPKDEIYYAVRT